MNLKAVVFIMVGATVVAAGGLIFTLFFVNPYEARGIERLMFYMTFFVIMFGSASLAGILVRRAIASSASRSGAVRRSVREGLLAAVLAIAVLLLARAELLNPLNAIVLVILAIVIEYFFITLEKSRTI